MVGLVRSTIATSLVSPIGGVVSIVRPYDDRTPGADGALRVVRLASAGRGRHPEHAQHLEGVGAGIDDASASNDALLRALGLYAAAGWEASAMRWASADELADEAIAVEDLARLAPIETRDRIRWVEGFALDDGRPMWLPAVLVHLGLTPSVEAENFWPASLSGLAVADNFGRAVLDALLDTIARDALAVALVRGSTLPVVSHGDGVGVFDATSDLGVPVALAQGRSSFEIGVAAATTIDDAAANAVDDLARRRARRALGAYPEEPPPDPSFELGAGTDLASAPPGSDPIDLSKPAIVGRLQRAGVAGFGVDLTSDEMEAVGLHAVRVVVPGLSPAPPKPGWADHTRLARALA
ncbi:MAG: ribosomal protein methylthiotransferase accessory factor [Actinomycetota bacterium]